jgi:hypothetical protein
VSGSLGLICLLLLGPQTASTPARDQTTDDRAAARAVLTDVLSQRAFANVHNKAWSMEFRRRLREELTNLLARVFGNRVGRPSAARGFAWFASAAAVCVLIVWLWRVQRRSRRAGPIQLQASARAQREWRALAQQAVDSIRAGRTREGARLAYQAAVQRLEEDGALPHDAARTPREYLRLMPVQHRRRPALATLTAAFERIWYGSGTASTDEGRDIVTVLQELECVPREQAN